MSVTAPTPTGLDAHAPKGYRLGAERTVAPAETVARVGPHLAAMGITRVANITGLDRIGIPVVMVCRPNGRSLSVTQGKGLDLAAARASGIMEAIESYHAEHASLPLRLASYNELRAAQPVVDIGSLPQLSDGQVDPDQPIHWVEGYDLLQREPVWAPYELVHTNYTLAIRHTMAGFVASSSGLASGNHLLEAICHGLCEVVERDAAALFNLLEPDWRAVRRVDLATVDDPACRQALDAYARAELLVGAWEITSHIGVPAFLCTIADAANHPLRRSMPNGGMGCHPRREIALLRALTEAAQARLTVIAGARDDCFRASYADLQDPNAGAGHRAELATGWPIRRLSAAPTWEADSFEEDLAWLLGRLRAAGLKRAVMVDLTRPEFGVPVARVIVPGLEAPGWAAGPLPGARARAYARPGREGAPQ